MKKMFNPPLKPWLSSQGGVIGVGRPITCPKCGSNNVWVHMMVHAYGFVNLNTGEVEDPEEGKADMEDALREEDRVCYDCRHEWTVDDV